MEAITLLLAIALRVALPIGFLFWMSARLQGWDPKEV